MDSRDPSPESEAAAQPAEGARSQSGQVLPVAREHLYTALVNIRNTELTVYWTRYNIQSALNTAVLVGALAGVKGSDRLPLPVLLAVAVGGFFLAVIWLVFAVYGKRLFVDGWEEWIAEYEENFLRRDYANMGSQAGPLVSRPDGS